MSIWKIAHREKKCRRDFSLIIIFFFFIKLVFFLLYIISAINLFYIKATVKTNCVIILNAHTFACSFAFKRLIWHEAISKDKKGNRRRSVDSTSNSIGYRSYLSPYFYIIPTKSVFKRRKRKRETERERGRDCRANRRKCQRNKSLHFCQQ